ncbi:MAG: hypothetical protein FJW38_30990 [Acidobacteria bacterium]|nr:hypothetical protein [Acidobacteriota bacterium]
MRHSLSSRQVCTRAKEICEIEFFPDAYNAATEFIAFPYASLNHLKQPNRDEGNKIKGFYQPR